MLVPKRVKHRKVQRGSMKGRAKGGTRLNHGTWGIQALEAHWITNRQIEAARIAMTRCMKRGGKVWITIFPDKPITKKPAETRMGSGKGNPEAWVAVDRSHHVPDRRRRRGHGQRGAPPCNQQVAHHADCDQRNGRAGVNEAAEIRELSADDLQAKLKEARAELFNLRFQMATSQLDNTARVKQVKKDIARIQTEMRARELSA